MNLKSHGIVILSPSLVILRKRSDRRISFRVNSAKNLTHCVILSVSEGSHRSEILRAFALRMTAMQSDSSAYASE